MTRTKSAAVKASPNDHAPQNEQPYILESSEFTAFLHDKRTAAQRQVDDLTQEITNLETDNQRLKSDADRAIGRNDAEILARVQRREQAIDVLARCDAALDARPNPLRPGPTFIERTDSDQA